jgi:hypothetical protein
MPYGISGIKEFINDLPAASLLYGDTLIVATRWVAQFEGWATHRVAPTKFSAAFMQYIVIIAFALISSFYFNAIALLAPGIPLSLLPLR